MSDTDPKIEVLYDQLLGKKNGEERLYMAASMFEASRLLVVNSILNRHPRISQGKLRSELFRRLYSEDFAPPLVDKIALYLEKTSPRL